jgi:hypothetical protein
VARRPIVLLVLFVPLAACAVAPSRKPAPGPLPAPSAAPALTASLPLDAAAGPAPLVPQMTGEGALDCAGTPRAAGHDVCCDRVCRSFAPTGSASLVETIGTLCAGDVREARAFFSRSRLRTCSDSSQCAPGALCCAVSVPSTVEDDLNTVAFFKEQICTADPTHDCYDVELCEGATCRAPYPKTAIPCGRTACTGDRPCFYRHTPTTMAYAAPTCETDADCAKTAPGWRAYLDREADFVSHCRPKANDPAHRSVCTMPK